MYLRRTFLIQWPLFRNTSLLQNFKFAVVVTAVAITEIDNRTKTLEQLQLCLA